MSTNSPIGLPPRIYVPIVAVLGILFLSLMAYLVADGFGVAGSVFGKASGPSTGDGQHAGSQNSVEGGPPAPVVAQIKTLRERIAAHPRDDVALTQLADMYLTANHFEEAIPLYRRALAVNPHNVAAQTGLAQARDAMRQ